MSSSNWIVDKELGLVPLEVHLLRIINHPNVVRFLDYYSDGRFAYLITELHGTSWTWPNPLLGPSTNRGLRPPGQLLQLSQNHSKEVVGVQGVTRRSPCDLFECIEAHTRLPFDIIQKIFHQLLSAIEYLFTLGIVHRDLKDENIVVDQDYTIKLIDFGSANFIPAGVANLEGYFEKFNGTLAFAAPEVVRGLRYRPSEAEVWSLGVLLYTIIFKKSPFSSTEAILHNHLELPIDDPYGVYDLIQKMLQKNPINRIPLDEIKEHTFLKKTINL